MSDVLITAIARSCDETELANILLQFAGMDARRLTLMVRDISLDARARSRMQFIPFRGYPANVPGSGSPFALSAYLIDDGCDHFKGIGISSDAAHYYNNAIDEGRSVVTYMASTESAASVEGRFRACGFVKIRRFPVA